MSRPLVIALPGNEETGAAVAAGLGGDNGGLELRRFPDGESYVRLLDDPRGRPVVLVATLDRPDGKFLPLVFVAATARELGAERVGLVAPYLPYLRQDARFHEGEAVTSRYFAHHLQAEFDWLVTVDPHLHRIPTLATHFRIPTKVVEAAPAIAAWIAAHVERPILIGPDEESAQWVIPTATALGCDYRILEKRRHGDRQVAISGPASAIPPEFTPVLVDDIAASTQTLIEAADTIVESGAGRPICIVVHPLFAGDGYERLLAKAAGVASSNSVSHPSNAIDIVPQIVAAVRPLVGS